ncbi:MAG: hypothetical protein ACRDRK_25475 [Pseudonocardia sp.]
MLTPGGPAERLRETAGPHLYQHNAFRIIGLSTDVTRRALRDFRQKVTLAADLGRPVERGELPLPVPATTEEILAALDDLLDPQRRIVHELFWFWDTPDSSCSCVSSLHADHDAAVRAHACVLDMELAAKHCSDAPPVSERQEHWVDAAARWCALLHRNAFWDHVRHRIEVLDDRRLDESTVDELRDTLPRALVTPVVDLAVQAPAPSWLVTQAERWQTGPHIVEDLLTEATAPCSRTSGRSTPRPISSTRPARPTKRPVACRRTSSHSCSGSTNSSPTTETAPTLEHATMLPSRSTTAHSP